MKTKPYKNTVGDNISRIRQERGLTQEELALMSGLSQGYINQLERGKRKLTQKTLTAIAEALDFPLFFFFKEEGTYFKRTAAREVFKVLKSLPPHIADHYMTLMSIEKELYGKKRR